MKHFFAKQNKSTIYIPVSPKYNCKMWTIKRKVDPAYLQLLPRAVAWRR